MGVSDEPVLTRQEFETYKQLAKELREGTGRELARLDREIDLVEQTAAAKLEALRKDVDARFAGVAVQRERDLADAREQREEDQDAADKRAAKAESAATHKREWTWQTKLALAGLGVALAGLYLQTFMAMHK